MLKRSLFIIFLSATILCGTAVKTNAAFLIGLEDIPLMSGMKQINQENISFGNEQGRLVEAYVTADKISFAEVEKFYKETLPQMGWNYQGKRDETLVFYRDGEAIDIAKESKNPLKIRITVKSRL